MMKLVHMRFKLCRVGRIDGSDEDIVARSDDGSDEDASSFVKFTLLCFRIN